ncbi:hypothetical protein L6164_002697 [Bauhinia variegata]|uniref:Uncharacterized protein n=1 Tax=Bauhinia variegata TaxID=167791 RepID=A0ACB9Q0H4_BAUVA|nr:hypothetical protein L6164_002697 [Bauhinia variegata]
MVSEPNFSQEQTLAIHSTLRLTMTTTRPLFRNSYFAFAVIFLIASPLFCSSPVLAKSKRPITDAETRQQKFQCYADIDSGLWGWKCKSSTTERENCALRCLSPACYELIYESDPLEEGEKDYVRSQEYKYCMHKLSLGENIDDVRVQKHATFLLNQRTRAHIKSFTPTFLAKTSNTKW